MTFDEYLREALPEEYDLETGRPIYITGDEQTGKTTLADVLRAIGYTHVIEEWHTKIIQICEALTDLQEKKDIFESLGISGEC